MVKYSYYIKHTKNEDEFRDYLHVKNLLDVTGNDHTYEGIEATKVSIKGKIHNVWKIKISGTLLSYLKRKMFYSNRSQFKFGW